MIDIRNKIINVKCENNVLSWQKNISKALRKANQGDELNVNGQYMGVVLSDKKPLMVASQFSEGIILTNYANFNEQIITSESNPRFHHILHKFLDCYNKWQEAKSQ